MYVLVGVNERFWRDHVGLAPVVCHHHNMSLFRKQPTSAPTIGDDSTVRHDPIATQTTPPGDPRTFNGATVDVGAIYRSAKLSSDELDRVARAEELLHHVPRKASQTREIVEATFRAFGVDQARILAAAKKQLEALEAFVRYSHEQTQRILDANAKRMAELEAEIERCRTAAGQATREGEERARTVNNELLKVQGVLEFFGEEPSGGLDEATLVNRPNRDDPESDKQGAGSTSPPPPPGKRVQRPSI